MQVSCGMAALLKGADIPPIRLLGDPGRPSHRAERLARRIAERSSTSDASDISTDFLPPEDMGPVATAAIVAPPRPTARLTPDSEKAAASAPAPEVRTTSGGTGQDEQESAPGIPVEELHRRAEAQFQAGHFIIALAMFERILKTQPLDGRARYGAALCAVQTGETRKARRLLNSLIAHRSRETLSATATARTPFKPAIGTSRQ